MLLHICMDETSIFCQHKDVTEIENVLNKEFADVCDWFFDNELSIHFGEGKTKCILFSRDKNIPELNIMELSNTVWQNTLVVVLTLT